MKTRLFFTFLLVIILINLGWVHDTYYGSISGSVVKNQLEDSVSSYTGTKVVLGFLTKILVYIKILILTILVFMWKNPVVNLYNRCCTNNLSEER